MCGLKLSLMNRSWLWWAEQAFSDDVPVMESR